MSIRLRKPAAGRRELLEAGVIACLILFPLVAPQGAVSLGFVALQYAIFALGLNIIVGWAGLLDLGAAGFVAVGAYTTAILMREFQWPALAALPAATAAGAISGWILGAPTLRHRADYFAILTLGFAELVALGIRNWPAVTRGSYGYSGIPPSRLPFLAEPLRAVPPIEFYYLALAVVIPLFCFCLWLRSTQLGRHLHVVKHSETVARACGVNVLGAKMMAFGISAALVATGGYFWAAYQRSIIWNEFSILLSCMLLSVIIVGGLGNLTGAAVGAALIGSSLELIRRFLTEFDLPQNARYLFFATLLILSVHLWPSGLVPDRPSWFRRHRRRVDGRATKAHVRFPTTSVGGAVLQVEGVSKSYGGIRALDDATLRVQAGECVALIGMNGSGKTTLLNTVSGLVRPDRGSIRLEGRRIDRMPAFRVARLGVARSFQDISVFDDVDLFDNVYLPAQRVDRLAVEHALSQFSLLDGGASTATLSYGQKKALDLARALVRPERLRLALLDEPTAGLSQAEARDVVRVLAAIRGSQSLAMIVVSHDVMFLESLGVDRVIVFHQGRVFKDGPFEAIRQDDEVRRLFWGEARFIA